MKEVMKTGILINLLSFTPSSATGVFVYADNLIRELTRIDSGRTYWIAVRNDMYRYLQGSLRDRGNVQYIVFGKFSLFLPRIAARIFKNRSILEAAIRRRFQALIDRHAIRVAFFPSGALYPRGLRNVASIVTLYDLQQEYFPENFSSRHLQRRREDNRYAAQNADRILTISEFTKKTVVENYGVREEKITVTHLAPRNFPVPEAISLPRQYIFYPAALWPHKNHLVLFQAFSILKNTFPELHVVLTGTEKQRNMLVEIRRTAEQNGVADRVHYLGHVSDSTLYTIYKNAAALVFPSSFEGFGVPLVEAFSLGVPVVAADNTSIPEIVDGAGILVPTGDAKALADSLERLLTDQKLRSELIAKGYERVKLFSWDKTAEATLKVFNYK